MNHFTDEETEAQLSPTLCSESLLVSGRHLIQPQVVSSNPEALSGVPGTRQALSKWCFASLKEAQFSNRETPVLDLHHEGGGRSQAGAPRVGAHPQPQGSAHAGTQQGEQGWTSGHFLTHRPAGPSASPTQTPAFSSKMGGPPTARPG